MISEKKDRVIATITKEQKNKLEELSRETGITKSVLISIALAGLFKAGYTLGNTAAEILTEEKENKK